MRKSTMKWLATALAIVFAGVSQVSASSLMKLEYFYAKDGTLVGRAVNGVRQDYEYDRRGQLLAVKDQAGNDVERYVYDPAGNILSKTVNGKTTVFTYDRANQLATSTVDGKTIRYEYDAAGRLVKEGDKTYKYGHLDKILEVQENGQQVAAFDYHVNGQIASATYADKQETFLWDDLALIRRNETSYLNEPYVTGGNPILAGNDVMFNDMLGTTLGVKSGDQFNRIAMTAFGESARPAAESDTDAFFTGKPHIGELGYAFFFRNYRADKGKWQTADPLDYPDGWNQFAYVCNHALDSIDRKGLCSYQYIPSSGGGAYAWMPCSESNPYASANITVTSTSKNTYTAVCGTSISGSKSFSFTVSATIAEIFEISTSFSESIDIGSSIFDAAPHDGSGEGFIKIGAVYSFTYYELGLMFDCGRKTSVTYHTVENNCSTKVVDRKNCEHE